VPICTPCRLQALRTSAASMGSCRSGCTHASTER
jgi:hypothetical protein